MWQRLYVEALLRDAILADGVWELWNSGVITDSEAERVWGGVCVGGWFLEGSLVSRSRPYDD